MTEDVGENTGTWVAHRGAAIVLRTVIFLIPVVLSVLGTAIISRALPPPGSTAVLILWWVLLSIAATSILYMTDKAARQLLPLHALLNLSLIFPDRAPSRFKAALRSSGVRQLERRIAEVKANGLGDSETEAAETLVELIGALAYHDRLTRGHAERVRAYSRMIGEEMGLDDDTINKLAWSGLMHDVGKLYVPSEILNKTGELTPDEFEIIKIHPAAGAELVEPLGDWLGEWVRAVGEHHERWDGGGYPAGLVGEEIALGARIVAVADAFDVLTSARSYKSPSSAAAARAEIQRCAGTQFDATVVRAFLNISVGRFRLVMGPLSWLAQAPIVGVPVAPAIGAMAGGFATAAGLLVGGFFQPPAIDAGPTSVIAAPAVEAPADPSVIASTTSSSTTSTSTTSTSTTSTTSPPAPAPTPSTTTTTTVVDFFPDTFESPNVPAPFQPPVVVDDTFSGVEDAADIFAPLANDGSGLAIVNVTQPSAGTVTVRLDSTVRFDPPSNWWGTTSFTYEARDARGLTSTAKVTIDYRNVPDAPQTRNDWLIRPEDSAPTTIDVTANDSDADLHGIRVTSITRVPSASPSLGTISITSSGLVRFAPDPNAFGNDTYVYFVEDPDGLTASGLLTVTLTAVNDPPIARNDVGSMNEDTVKTFSVRSNDYDVDGGPLTTTSATSAYGSASTNGTTVTYRPAPNSFGTQTVTYTISDGRGGTASAVLTVNVAPVNDPPVARNDNGSMTEDDPTKVFSVLSNDTDIDGGPLSITSVSSAFGTATTNGSTVSYRPNPNGNGIHTVSYTVSDGRGGTDTATLRINVAEVNDPPSFTAGGDDTVAEDSGPRSATGWATNISAGPLDELGQTLTFTVTAANPSLFSVQPAINATTGTLTYTPAPDANGITPITVKLTDSGGASSAPQTAQLIITAVNDPPSFTAGAEDTVAEDSGPRTVSAWATNMKTGPPNESSQTLSFTTTSDNPGLFSAQPTVDPISGDLTYTPEPNANGTATITVTLVDSKGGTSAPANAEIKVTPVNDPPVFTAGPDDTVAEDAGPQSVAGWATGVGAGPIDEFAQTLTFTVTADDPSLFSAQPAVDAATGTLTYTPADDANGTATITVTLTDSQGGTSAPQTATLTLTPVNDPPVAAGEAYAMDMGATLTVPEPGLMGNDGDPDGDPISVLLAPSVPPSNGSLTLTAGGGFTYTPNPTFVGVDTFTYQVGDPGGLMASAEVEIFVDSGITSQGWYLGTSGANASNWDLVGAPLPVLPPGDPEPDHDTDDDPGLTIKDSNQRLTEDNPDKFQHWTLTPTTPLALEGPVTLDLWSTVKDFEPGKDADYSAWLHDCAPDGTDCQLITSVVEVNLDDWNEGSTDWVFKSLPVGSADHTVAPGRMVRLRLMFDHEDIWLAMSGDRPSQIVFSLANMAPVASPDTFSMLEDAPPTPLAVLDNDVDATLDPASVNIVAPGPSLGGAAPQPDGTIIYAPTADANGTDSFEYEVCDHAGLCDTATVNVTITPVNDPPSFTAGANEVVADDSGPQTVPGWATSISAGPANESAQVLTFDVTADDPSLFSAQPAIDATTGDLTYTPAPNSNGTTTLTITLDDSAGGTSPAQTAEITISADNDSPTLDPIGAVGGPEASPITFTATASDPDLPPDTLTFSLDGEPAGAVINPTSGAFTWTPTEAQGPGSFTFDVIVTDDGVPQGTDSVTITVTVTEANVAPTIDVSSGASVGSGTAVTITPAMLAASDPDLPAQTLTYTLSTAPPNGAVERTGLPIAQGATFTEAEIAAGDIAYRHDGSSTTTDTFEITASDGAGGISTAASFPITVAVVSPTPITIGEIRTDSQSGRDFVELYNGSYRDIDLGAENWTVVIEDLNGAVLETVTLTGTFPINATALIVEAGYTGFGTPDATATIATFPRGAGFSVRKAGVEIDAVGTSSGSSFAEGTPLPRMGGTLDQAYVRKNGWGRGACVDTDDNAADFTHKWALFASTPTGIADGFRFPCLGPAPAPPAPPPATHPVIREYRSDGPGGGSDEFVEIFNPGPDQVMTGWTVELNKLPFEYVYVFPAGYVLESGRHFLIAGSGYTGAATPDAPTAVGITNGTGVVLWGPAGGRIDTLGIETGSQWFEPNLGVGLPRIDGRTYHSFERRNNGCTDTNNNFYDFEHHLGFDTPTNNSAGVFPCV